MMALTRVRSFPANAQSVADKLATLGYREGRIRYVANHDIADPEKVLQVRNIRDQASPKRVAHYKEMLKPHLTSRDTMTMPPAIFTADGWLVDGNTRETAARQLGWLTFPAIVLDDVYENAPQAVLDTLIMVGTMFNLTHGDGLGASNVEMLIDRLLKDDTSPADLARKLQVSRTTVTGCLNAQKARRWAMDLGVDMTSADHFTRTHWSDLGSQREKFTTPVFQGLLTLARDTRMSSNDLRALIRSVNSLRDEAAKLGAIAAEAVSREGIRTRHATKPLPPAQARQHCGFFLSRVPGDLVEQDPGNFLSYRRTLRQTIDFLENVLQEQYDMERKREAAAGAR